MHEREKGITVVGEWVEKAGNDLKNAAHTLKMGTDCPTDTVCFHAQQVVEKYLKALLVFRGISFPKIYNIEELVALLPARDRPELSETEQDRLTDYATVTRYRATTSRSRSPKLGGPSNSHAESALRYGGCFRRRAYVGGNEPGALGQGGRTAG